jgi:hypothetical protein
MESAGEMNPMFVPPTSCWFVDTPGTRTARLFCNRPDGTASMMSLSSTRCCAVEDTSTTGASPETVIVSSRPPTRSSAFTVALNDPVSSMPSRLTVEKPGRLNVTT